MRTRVGIATGEVIAGNVGSGSRLNYTVHGDAVNLAARLEQLNKSMGTDILIDERTVASFQRSLPVVPLGEIEVRGREQLINIYTVSAN